MPERQNTGPSPVRDAYAQACLSSQLPADTEAVSNAAVALRRTGGASPFCSGVIVEPGVLLTARHCLFSPEGGGTTQYWSYLAQARLEIVTAGGAVYRVACATSDAEKKSPSVISCAARSSTSKFGVDSDFLVLNIVGLPSNFQGMKMAVPKQGSELLLFAQFEGIDGPRYSKTGCTLAEVKQRCAIHRCQAGHSSSGGPLIFRNENNELRVGGIHVGAIADSPACGMDGSEQVNAGVLLTASGGAIR